MSKISESDYKHAQQVWEEFGVQNIGDYHSLYLRTDVVLLGNIFEAFRDTCLKHYSLDPAIYTAPGSIRERPILESLPKENWG